MTWTIEDSRKRVLSACDSYMDWALWKPGAGQADYLPHGADGYRVRMMVRPRAHPSTLLRQLNSLPEAQHGDWRAFVSALEDATRGKAERLVTFFYDPAKAVRLFDPNAGGGVIDLEDIFDLVTFGPPLPASGMPGKRRDGMRKPRRPAVTTDEADAGLAAPPRPVVVGIIDDGLAFGHERFRLSATKTRFEAVWLQGPPDDGVLEHGREILATDIDGWLTASAGDEDAFYDLAGVLDFGRSGHKSLAQRHSHGTHVLDEAFGLDFGAQQDWRIIGVQLPISVVADSSGALLTPFAIDAVAYIERKARQLVPGAPIVVAFSYGFTAGPHDGTHPIERGIDEIVTIHNNAYPDAQMRVIIPAGNSHLARLHASVHFSEATDPSSQAKLYWRVQPCDTTPSFVEIWLPGDYDPGGRISVALTTPDGEESGHLIEGENQVLTLQRDGLIICQVFFRADSITKRGMFLIALQPTERLDSGPVAPAGLWTIRLANRGFEGDSIVDAWIQRDQTPFGYPPRGRQSYFDHADYRQFDETGCEEEEDDPGCIVQRAGSLNAMATGSTPLVVGGLMHKELRPPKYSAGGKDIDGSCFRPSALATCDDSLVHGGVIAAGTRSGSWVTMNGTSAAGPRLARWIAGRMEGNQASDRDAVEDFAKNEEQTLPSPRPTPERGGVGRLRLPHRDPQPRHQRLEE